MKIELSKEHIKKGCDLVEGYELREDGLRWKIYYINDADSPLYRDFLQLVIEGINRESGSKNKIVQTWSCVKITYRSKKLEYTSKTERYPFSAYTITQAKEKAIAYVFKNKEAE